MNGESEMTAIRFMSIGRKLMNVYASLTAPLCRKYEINQTSFDILLFCANNPAYNTARDICEIRGIKSGIASVAVETLIQNGYLLRSTDPDDRRKHRLVPTEKAFDIIRDGQAAQAYFAETLKQSITEEEAAAFGSLTAKLEANLTLFGKKGDSVCL